MRFKQKQKSIQNITFSRWSRKGYAVFASLTCSVRIGQLSVSLCDCSLLKTGKSTNTRPSLPNEKESNNEEEIEEQGSLFTIDTLLVSTYQIVSFSVQAEPTNTTYFTNTTTRSVRYTCSKQAFFYFIMIEQAKIKVLKGEELSYNEAVELSKHHDKQALFKGANEIRSTMCGNRFDLCSITNAKSGSCSEDCKWCSQSAHFKTNAETYEIVDRKQAVSEAVENGKKGVRRHSLVTSGKRVSDRSLNQLIPIYKAIKAETNIHLCASMGLITRPQLKRLRDEVGITHYHCNLETAPSYFGELCSTHTIDEKIETIKQAQGLGLKVCSGGIIGMGETMEQRIELACTLRDLSIDSIPINLLMPVPGTPMEDKQPLSEEEILTSIALFRFINPKANIRFAGGRALVKSFQNKALFAGINSALTGDYLTTSGSNVERDVEEFRKAGYDL